MIYFPFLPAAEKAELRRLVGLEPRTSLIVGNSKVKPLLSELTNYSVRLISSVSGVSIS